jgi:hypothetical protein
MKERNENRNTLARMEFTSKQELVGAFLRQKILVFNDESVTGRGYAANGQKNAELRTKTVFDLGSGI